MPAPPAARVLPSGVNATDEKPPPASGKGSRCCPEATSQRVTSPISFPGSSTALLLTAARSLPSAENVTRQNGPQGLRQVRFLPLETSHRLTHAKPPTARV